MEPSAIPQPAQDGAAAASAWTPALGSPFEMELAEERLAGRAFPVIFERGRALAASGGVHGLALEERRASARVRGSEGQSYEAWMEAAPASAPGAEPIPGSCGCECPFADSVASGRTVCKHVIALGLAAHAQYRLERELGELERAAGPARAGLRAARRI